MLLQILEYLKKVKVASNQQMAREFQVEVTALQPMLDLWLRKGNIACCQEKAACQSSCFKCQKQPPIYYQYLTSSCTPSMSVTHARHPERVFLREGSPGSGSVSTYRR